MRKTFTVMIVLFISACIALPATKEVTNSNCDLVTREMYVDSHTLGNLHNLNGSGNLEAVVVLAAAGLIIYSVSWVISGSIVLSGNTIHWLETKGRCNERESETVRITKDDNLACKIDSGQCTVLR
jgi:hypothetical protein